MSRRRFLVLGGGEGWHATQLRESARTHACDIAFATYESLRATVGSGEHDVQCDAGRLQDYDAVLTRTMPAGSLEKVTFRLATLHHLDSLGRDRFGDRGSDRSPSDHRPVPLINPPRSLELAIDKFATLAHVATHGHPVPDTIVVQSRDDAMEAFDGLGGDCVVKPIFGGEGRGVMRISDRQLAWYTFSTLEQLDAVAYVQAFVAPGGVDTRLLVVGDEIIALRRRNGNDFRTNVASGGRCRRIVPSDEQRQLARQVVDSMGLFFASVDLIDDDAGAQRILEVNGIPGWKGAQQVCSESIADRIIQLLHQQADAIGPRGER